MKVALNRLFYLQRNTLTLKMATAAEGWKRSGLIKGPGIPAPSGQYKVGCVYLIHKFSDEDQSLLVRLYYPSQDMGHTSPSHFAKWISHKRYSKGYLEYTKTSLPGFISSLIGVFTEPRIPAFYASPLFTASAQETGGLDSPVPQPVFPVIVFSHGLGAMSATYSAICCDVASHGYVVASVEHRDRSAAVARLRVPGPREGEWEDEWLTHLHLREGQKEFPFRNEQVKQRAVDARKALDLLGLLNEGSPVGNLLGVNFDFAQFKGRLNMETAAMIGHSFGGATTIQTLSEDQRFKCGVGLDTWMLPVDKEVYENGSIVQQPLLFINSYAFQWKENIQQMTRMTEPASEGISTCKITTLKGTNHYYQTDLLFVFPGWIGSPRDGLDPATAHQVNMDMTHSFLKRHLLNDPAFQGPVPNLDGTDGHSPHILFGTNVDISESPSECHVTPSDEQSSQAEPIRASEDHMTPPEDNVVPSEDHVTPTEDNVVPSDDHVTPTEDHVAPSEDHVTPSEDHVTQTEDHVDSEEENADVSKEASENQEAAIEQEPLST